MYSMLYKLYSSFQMFRKGFHQRLVLFNSNYINIVQSTVTVAANDIFDVTIQYIYNSVQYVHYD